METKETLSNCKECGTKQVINLMGEPDCINCAIKEIMRKRNITL